MESYSEAADEEMGHLAIGPTLNTVELTNKDFYIESLKKLFPLVDENFVKYANESDVFENCGSLDYDIQLSMLIEKYINYNEKLNITNCEASTSGEINVTFEDENNEASYSAMEFTPALLENDPWKQKADEENERLFHEFLSKEELHIVGKDPWKQKADKENERLFYEFLSKEESWSVEKDQWKQKADEENEKLFREFLKKEETSAEQKYQTLIKIFPNANPEFIKKIVADNHHDPSLLQQEVENKLVLGKYQTREEYYKKLKEAQNTAEPAKPLEMSFNVEEFLKNVPDPFTFFQHSDRICFYNVNAVNFLNHRYLQYSIEDIIEVYALNKYNLTKTNNDLINAGLVVSNNKFLNPPADIIYEVQFIENKKEIKQYIDHKEQEKLELDLLRDENLLLECQCCFSECKPTDCQNCENFHIFCNSCIKKAAELAVSNGQSKVACLTDCSYEFSLVVIESALSQESFQHFLKKRQAEEIKCAKLEGLENCPNCNSLQLLGAEDKVFMCNNEMCMKITCRFCKRDNHLPFQCEEVLNEHTGRLLMEEKMSEAFIRTCYKCNAPFLKKDGCNKIQCKCGAKMCYICKQPIDGYSHFNNHGPCKLYQSPENIDRKRIESERNKIKEMLKKDFNVDL